MSDSAEVGNSRLVERLAELVGGSAGASKIFGEAVARDGITIVPVARARWGFGGGGGQDAAGKGSTGSGGGGGVVVRPAGFIEIADGRARFRRIVDPAGVGVVLLALMISALVIVRRRRGPQACRRCAARRDAPDDSVAGEAPVSAVA
jgi:uncharacterized spore protein YtfJ